ncbi:MAG: hypothetical protein ACI83W_001034 [Marinoscillum sp.]
MFSTLIYYLCVSLKISGKFNNSFSFELNKSQLQMKHPNQLAMVVLSLIFSIQFATAQTKLSKTKITKEISIGVPETFVDMSTGERVSKFVSARAPIAMFTSQDRLVDLGINQNSTTWPDGDLEILRSFYKANISNLFTEVKFIQEDIREINGRDFIILEFVSKITDEESTFGGNASISKYSYIQYTIYNNRVLLFNFSCPSRIRSEWEATAKEIMGSIQIKS